MLLDYITTTKIISNLWIWILQNYVIITLVCFPF
jgi:hypothetical protein